ncbi:CPBP family intramembrane glutamic endopeptidase [Lactiplantibacillus argentoratensis]|jgi:membrane protease YdiL (CAAX protease family)|uniref:CPBP family intramembrane metalloprotease n=1 Tax=Lactiplantibacillus argentoratensis TaxID=271881 RepID=A0AAN1PYX8_9LACO|nr:CPBP family intramembrane glutamic endopeptidase [Lactiplantibacillus argentoratensis]KON39980.1 membrane protein [Lactiplantibacillus plantarum]GEK63498.1 membrane protein [Lactobacillus japonicus]AYJ34598.1 CPBP family intramembrane metalloprotease [Lactiplantibacillus argentoratensis]KTF02795.1 integral membrane protein PlnW membrane-bound protease CAAX family [Lactiplantibacillus plantarum]KZT79667.1 integral membrane protein PlnW membrane-boundprotease CAAX family [Lactiplantibacillus 
MLQKNLRFIGNLLIVSVLSVIIVNISSLPVYIYLITANWFTLLVSFSLYAVIIVFLYNIYKTTAELRQFDFRPWRTRLNKRALLLMVIGAVIIVALAFGYAKLTAVWHITESGNERALDLLLRKNPVAMTLDAVIFGPIAEELSFRGFFFSYVLSDQYLDREYQAATIVINGLLFGYLHSGNSLVPLAYYTLFGMVLGTTYLLSKHDIRVNSVTHMLANLGILWLVPS